MTTPAQTDHGLPEGFDERPSGPVCVLGAGTWGTALADALARNGLEPKLWDHKPERLAASMAAGRHHKLADYEFHPGIGRLPELSAQAVGAEAWLVMAVPSFAMRATLEKLKAAGAGGRGERFVLCAKGLELPTKMTMMEVVADVFGPGAEARSAVLCGPSHAEEVSRQVPTTIVSAADDLEMARAVQALFINDRLRVYAHCDTRGAELGGAFKNVYAIAAGVAAGLGFGDNTLAAIMTRGLAEMSRLGVEMGGSPRTFAGLSGLGDLIVTCTSQHSRNRRFGELRARGRSTQEAMDEIGQAVEGVRTAKSAYELAVERDIDMPIVEEAYAVIHQGKDPAEAVHELMTRDPKEEDTIARRATRQA